MINDKPSRKDYAQPIRLIRKIRCLKIIIRVVRAVRCKNYPCSFLFRQIDTAKLLCKQLAYLFQRLTFPLSDHAILDVVTLRTTNLLYISQVLLALHVAAAAACVVQTVAYLPLLALEILLNLQHNRSANPCTVVLNTLVLATGATALHFHAMSVSCARGSNYLCLNFHNLVLQFFNYTFKITYLLLQVIHLLHQACHLGL